MGRLRLGLATGLVWIFVFYNIERYHEPINLASFVYVLAAAAALAVLLVKPLERSPLWLVLAILLTVFVVVKAWRGTPLMGLHLPLTVTEACALTLTTVMAHRWARSIREFEDAVLRLGLLETPAAASFEAAQSELYREVRRARRQRRPLALAALKIDSKHVLPVIPRVIQEVQKSCAQELVSRSLGNVLARSVEDEGWVIQRGDHFLVLLPESDHEQALETLERVQQVAAAELGVELQRGLAAFPDEEVTFTGLVERAEAQMRGDEPPLPEHGWRLPEVSGETSRVNGNGNGRIHRLDAAPPVEAPSPL